MNENENNFESLRRLLVLKRHETPPPGYFNYFSSQVLQRIRAGDTGKSANWLEDLFDQALWLGKLLQAFDVKPVFASAFAGALCLLLFLGIIYAERPDFTSPPLLQAVTTTALRSPPCRHPCTSQRTKWGSCPAPIQCSAFSRSLRFLDSKIRSPSRSAFHFPATDPI